VQNLKLPAVAPDVSGLTLESYYVQHGFVQVTISKAQLSARYFAVDKTNSGRTAQVRDSVTLDLQRHKLIPASR